MILISKNCTSFLFIIKQKYNRAYIFTILIFQKYNANEFGTHSKYNINVIIFTK